MTVKEALENLHNMGQDMEFKTIGDRCSYFMSIGFLRGTIDGLLLHAPREVRIRMEDEDAREPQEN